VRREALLFRVEVKDRHLRPVAAGSWSWGQPDLGGAREGGKQPWQSRDVSALPDGAGPASELERSTRGTGVITPFKLVTGSNLADVGRVRCFPAGWVYRRESPGRVLLAGPGGHGEGLRRTCGDAAGAEPGSSFGKRTAV